MSSLIGRAATVLAGCSVAVLLCACGGGGGQAGRSSSSPLNSKSHGEAQAKQGKARDRAASDGGSAPKKEPDSAVNHPSPARSAEKCPKGVSEQVCARVAEIRKQQSDNPPLQKTGAGKCPAVMSRSVCEAVTQAYKAGLGNGRRLKPRQCPPTLSQVQCAELAKAYAKRTK